VSISRDVLLYSHLHTAQCHIDRARAKFYEPDRQFVEVRGLLFVFRLVLHVTYHDPHSLHVLHWKFGGARKEIEVYDLHQVQGQCKQECMLLFPVRTALITPLLPFPSRSHTVGHAK